jgi:hypothetical protein
LLRLIVVWRLEPAGEVALEPVQVSAGNAVVDVAVRPDEVVRRLSHTQPRERVPVDGGGDHGRVEQVNLERGGADGSQPTGGGIGASDASHIVPGLDQAGMAWRPMTPVAPVTRTFMLGSPPRPA